MQAHLQRTPASALSPGASQAPPGEQALDRLAVSSYRRAPPSQKFSNSWLIAWRSFSYCQVPHQ